MTMAGMVRCWASLLLLLQSSPHASGDRPTRVLFVGEEFGGVPGQLARVASSLGVKVHWENSTLADCTAYALLLPQQNSSTTRLLQEQEWDFIVLRTLSVLPTVVHARYLYLRPAVEAIVKAKKNAKVVMYMPHAAHDGVKTGCPATPVTSVNHSDRCFPLGTLEQLINPPCSTDSQWSAKVKDFDCMTYSLARGCLSAVSFGADMMAPCGLAWESVRSSGTMPWGPARDCVDEIDAEYGTQHSSPLSGAASLPLREEPSMPDLTHLELSTRTGSINHTTWRDTVVGEYLDALVLFATLFGTSPVGCALPLSDSRHTNGTFPSALDAENASHLQSLAGSIVLSHYKVWGSTPPQVLPANPTHPNPLLLDLEVGVAAGVFLLLVCAILRPVLCQSQLRTAVPRPSPIKATTAHRRRDAIRSKGGGPGGATMVDPLMPRAEPSFRAGGNSVGSSRAVQKGQEEEDIDDLSRGRYQEV